MKFRADFGFFWGNFRESYGNFELILKKFWEFYKKTCRADNIEIFWDLGNISKNTYT